MAYPFYKYQGTGNDFVIIDNRQNIFPKNNTKLVAQMCDRKFGVGADGLLLLETHPTADFTMVYYNSDGRLSSMCGNGGRCIVHFARFLKIVENAATFVAVDGMHHATIQGGEVSLQMQDVLEISIKENSVFLNTGSPHHVKEVDGLAEYNVYTEGKRLRTEIYGEAGANINFVEQTSPDTFLVRTYERGVENETLSCGTGVTAVAIAMHTLGNTSENSIHLQTPGGNLNVSFTRSENTYTDIYLTGPATQVFKGTWE
jgi:diaminopimelate epimerase